MALSGNTGFQPRPMKLLFQRNGVWADLLETYPLRSIEVETITKMLACGTSLLGAREIACENPACSHRRLIFQSCKGRGCPSCGKKATDNWIATMMSRLPDTPCQHGSFTLPDTLWPLFEINRGLLGALFSLAADNLLYAAQDYATGEMRRMLNSLANEPVDVDTVILKLKEYNYLNDERIAENLLSRLLKKQYGLTRIRLEIRQKGIKSDVIENVLNSLDIDWFEMASESRIKKFGEAIPIEPKEKARQIRYLQSRGFSMDMIMESLSPQTD